MLFTTFSILFASEARAEDSKKYELAIRGDLPEMKLNAAHQIEFLFSKNRVAKIAFNENRNKNFDFNLRFSNSSCEIKGKAPSCSMTTWLSFYYIKLLWTQHPDQKMINTPVEFAGGQNTTPSSFLDWTMLFWNNISQKSILFEDSLKNALPTSFRCDQYNWLAKNSNFFDKISYETFNVSKETNLIEKKTVALFEQVGFLENKNLLTLKSMKAFDRSNISNIVMLSAPLSAETVVFTIKNKNTSCAVQFERDTSRNQILQKMQSSMTDYSILKFPELEAGVNHLTQVLSDEMVLFDPRYEAARKQLPLVIQALEVFGLVRVEYIALSDGHLKIVVTVQGPMP